MAVEPLEDEAGLRIAFHDSTLKGGEYVFLCSNEGTAAGKCPAVALWQLCSGEARISPVPGEGHNGPDLRIFPDVTQLAIPFFVIADPLELLRHPLFEAAGAIIRPATR